MVQVTLGVQVVDTDPYADWAITGVTSNPSEAWWAGWRLSREDPHTLRLRGYAPQGVTSAGVRAAGAAGDEYLVTLVARDRAGNTSAPYVLHIPVSGGVAGGAGLAQIGGVVALPAGRGVEVSFTLAAAASVQAEVVNLAGRPIKTLAAGRDCDQGAQTVVWNRTNNQGARVPNGSYLVRLTARTADGQMGTRVCRIELRR